MDGEGATLKEYTIGVEALDRPADFDPKTDTIVRVQIHRLREKLTRYYDSEGKHDPVRVGIPNGGYRLSFGIKEIDALPEPNGQITELPSQADHPSPSNPTDAETISRPSRPERTKYAYIAAAAFSSLIAAVLFLTHFRTLHTNDGFHDFWQPMLAGGPPVMVYLGTNTSYRLTPSFLLQFHEKYKLPDSDFDQPIDVSKEEIHSSDLQPNGPLVGLGDTIAASRIASTLTGLHKTYDMRYGPDLGITDLHGNPAILIGGFSNRRSIEMMQDLHFRLEKGDRIVDHERGDKSWTIHYSTDNRVIDDYVIISRIPKSETGGFVLAISGVATFSNQAAADFISDRSQMNALLQKAPSGWQHMNMQIVLHTRAIEMIPVSTNVEATAYW